MRIRFAVPITLAPALVFFAGMLVGAPAQAQRPGEHPGGGATTTCTPTTAAFPNLPHIAMSMPSPKSIAAPADASIVSLTSTKITGLATIVPMTSVTSSRTPSRMAASNISVRPIAITSTASISARTVSGFPAVFRLKSLRGIGTWPPAGAGIAPATTS